MTESSPSPETILFVTGRLAESSLRRTVSELAERHGFRAEIAVIGVSVAALMHTGLVARRLAVPPETDRIILPGWCGGSLEELEQQFGLPVARGPKDLLDLPRFFGQASKTEADLSAYDIEILAEINHAPHLSDRDILDRADRHRRVGADLIDLGLVPGERWERVGEVVGLLRADGHRVSIDSFDRTEVEAAVAAGAERVLSVNGSNVEWAIDLPVEWVAIPDFPPDGSFSLDTLEQTVERMETAGRTVHLDPILEPIGFGFAASLDRYRRCAERWPDRPMMMGIGNLTELTEVDSAGVNMILAAIAQEIGVTSVLTTEVIGWARTAVAEFDLARRLVKHATDRKTLPKHMHSGLVMLRDARPKALGNEVLAELASLIRDPNFRIFAEGGTLHIMNRDGYHRGTDPFELFDAMITKTPDLTGGHAFYLGYELAKAVTAITLGKTYEQDHALNWGLATVEERSAIERRAADRTRAEADS